MEDMLQEKIGILIYYAGYIYGMKMKQLTRKKY